MWWLSAALTAALACALLSPVAGAAASTVPGELLVRFDPDMSASGRAEVRQRADTPVERALPVPGLQLVSVAAGDTTSAADARLERQHGVLYAEPNRIRSAGLTPDDSLFGALWGLSNTGQAVRGTSGVAGADIDANAAWDLTTGAGVTIAVVDTGVDAAHPDLAPNYAGGWDWVDNDSDPADLHGHGTHVAGTAAARGGDGIGVAGVSWNASIMALRILDANGSGSVADAIDAYEYAGTHGAHVLNASFGGGGYSQAERDAIQAQPDVLFVAAAGNDGTNNDLYPEYPCSYAVEHLVCVAASNQSDGMAGFSNYGSVSVDLAAPGTNVLSSIPGADYGYKSGTSMATPHVAGTAALVFAGHPGATPLEVKQALLAGVDPKPAFSGKTSTGGRLNALRALTATPESPPPSLPPATAPPPVADTEAPRVALRVARVSRLRTVLRRGIRIQVTCSEACSVDAKALLRNRQARVTPTARISVRGTRTLLIRLSRGGKQRLRRARLQAISLAVNAADRAGNTRSLRRVLRVKRAG